MRALYLIFLIAGILCLVGGLFFTRLTWRPDVEPFGRNSRLLQIALRPERYAGPARLSLIRTLNACGGLLLLGAIAVLVFDIAGALRDP
jgi:hypothetical protein